MIAAVALLGLALADAPPSAPPSVPPSFFAAHRERFLAKLPAGSIAVLHAAPETSVETSPDPYRQSSDFWYLTGFGEPESIAVLIPASPGSAARFLLFVRPRDFPAEQWTGWRAGVEGAKKDFGAEAYPIDEFWKRLPALASGQTQALYYESGGDEAFGRKLLETWNAGNANALAPRPAADASPILAELRLVKDPVEVELLRVASRISAEAHRAAMAQVAPGNGEWDLKAAMVGTCLARGAARMAYPPIVGSGRNGVVLHYVDDAKRLADGEFIVNDTACEYGMYASDVTRSYPVSGRFSEEQRKIYEIVLAAQKAGFAAVRPGAAFHEVHDATVRVVVDGLLALGILTGDRAEILRTRAYQKFYPHGSSHWVGLNVHDAGSYQYPPGVERLARYGVAQTKLEPGMVLTVEPGIYIPEGCAPDPRWNDLGARVEDVVLVTAAGMDCLSCGAPREIADVEKTIAEGRAKAKARAAAKTR
ncbi:MAG TPA: aminopeptidase P N-terminal domain-containing protein [Thermoanaerobaculia bacterium]|nr:aminopeptidase P N-terminal domain-containing protein [Thermoanaerobaculia bacterium]